MKTAINFVRGAVAKNDAIPILTQMHVYDGRIQASNGRICIDAPCDELKGLNFTSPVKSFVLAIDNCEGEPNLSVKNNTITVKSGKFKATLAALPEEYPVMSIDKSKAVSVKVNILPVLRRLQPFIGTDNNRPWSCGIFFDGENAYATNNVVMVKTDCDNIGTINLSAQCVEELLRIREEPTRIITDISTVTFVYESGAWLKANTLSTNWPEVSQFIPASVGGITLTDELKRDINKVSMFVGKDSTISLGSHGVSTLDKETIVENYDLPESYFNSIHLGNVITSAKIIDFAKYPAPCPFIGDEIKGVIIGVRT